MHTYPRILSLLAAFGLLLAAGCSSNDPAPTTALPSHAGAVQFKEVQVADVTALLEQHKGKVVLLNFWAYFCPPCKAEYPHLVKLHKEHADAGLVILSVALDPPADSDSRTKGLAFLAQHQPAFPTLAPASQPALEEMAKHWNVEGIPLNLIYDRAGKLEQRIVGADIPAIEAAIKRLLQEK